MSRLVSIWEKLQVLTVWIAMSQTDSVESFFSWVRTFPFKPRVFSARHTGRLVGISQEMHHLSLYLHFVKLRIRSQMEYRLSFIFDLFAQASVSVIDFFHDRAPL